MPVPRRHIAVLVVIGLIASAIGIAIGIAIDWFPVQASSQGPKIDDLYDVLVAASVPFFVLVVIVVLYSAFAFRMRPGQERLDGPPIHGNTKLEVVWTLIPAILLVTLCTYAYTVLHDAEAKQPNELVVNVSGQQFAWSFEYPASKAGGKKVVSNELYLPANRPVYFNISSQDVLHDFWVPEFRMKVDAVPGIVTHYRITPTRLGKYPVVCAELCGLGHAAMRQTAHVIAPAAFQAWLKQRAGGGATGGGTGGGGGGADLAAAGKAVFTSSGCGACHTLADAGSTGSVGPDLGKVLSGKDAAFVETSIVDPNAEIAKGFPKGVMPTNYKDSLSAADLKALIAYLLKASK